MRFGILFEVNFDEEPQVFEVEGAHQQISLAIVNLVQQGAIFQGLLNEDPNNHLTSFVTITTTCNPRI